MADKVNVLLHGIFGYVFTPQWIEAYSPAVCGHIYRVSRSRSVDIPGYYKPLPASDLILKGVQVGWPFHPCPKRSPVVNLAKGAMIDEFNKRYCKIRLPYPTAYEGQPTRPTGPWMHRKLGPFSRDEMLPH